MKQKIHKDFMALVVPRSPPPLCVTVAVGNHPKLKIRIPIPKALIKAIQGKGIEDAVREEEKDQFNKRKKKRLEKLKEMIPKKVSSILPSVFRSKKSAEIRFSSDGDGGSEGEKCGEGFGEGNFGGKENDGVLMIVKQGSSSSSNSRLGRLLSNSHGKVKIGWSMRRNEGSFKQINCGETGQEEGKEEQEEELCKKRILMGEKCTPLNHSGVLHYDQDGVLLPDFLW